MHGYFKVADALNSQVDSFLSNTELFKKNPEFDIQWSLLSLLCGLTSNLTSVSKVPALLPISKEEEEIKDNVNWAEILKNDIPNNNFEHFYETDVDDSSLLEDSENEIKNDLQEEKKEKFKVIIKAEEKTEFDSASRQEAINKALKYREERTCIENDKKKWGDFNRIYEAFMNSQGICRTTQLISMYEVIEKILFQFQSGDDIFKRRGITAPVLSCLTRGSLNCYLTQYEPYFDIIRTFKEFMSDMANSRFQRSNNASIPNVLKAYNAALSKALESFDEKIVELDSNKESLTLLSAQLEIRPYFSDLALLYNAHRKITENWLDDENWMCAVKIISVLYNSMTETANVRMSRIFLNMFLHCFQVYLDIIDTWIACLKLMDTHGEFLITRSKGTENSFCEYIVRPYKEVLLKLKIPKMEILDFITDKMIHVGQSLEVLSKLERYDSQENILSYKPKESLYKLLQKDIQNNITRLTCTAAKPIAIKEKSIFTIKNSGNGIEKDEGGGDHQKSPEKKEEKCAKYNGFFDKAFQDVFSLNLKFQEKCRQDYASIDFFCTCCSEQQSSDFLPLRMIVKQHVKSLLNDRVINACKLVNNIILEDFNLKKHVALLRSVMFFNDAYLILPFTFIFFNQPSTWQNSYQLTLHLKECVEITYKELASKLTVVVAEDSSNVNSILEAIDSISIRYEVDWPVNLILNEKNMKKYNEIFRLILKLKWGHSMLCNLRFQSYDPAAPAVLKTTYHRLQLLRNWCLSALNRVINYYMAQVSAPFSEELASCQHLKDIINVHENFIRKIHSRCLLTENETNGRNLIFNALLPLCKDLRDFWRRGTVVAESKLALMENIFQGCQQQLSLLMAYLEKD